MPHRTVLLEQLRAYQPEDEGENRMRSEMMAFVKRESACFERSTSVGHMTGSAWVVDWKAGRVVLLHHARLGKWLQPGGHADGDGDLERVARREVMEETGLDDLILLGSGIFDVDIHEIPARASEPAHLHYDVRLAFGADANNVLRSSSESVALEWMPLAKVSDFSQEESILRMLRKTSTLPPFY